MIEQRFQCLALVVFCLIGHAVSAAEIVLAENGQSQYKIVVADNASPSTKHGAEELQKFLAEMTGATLPIISDQQPASPKEIILGDNAHLQKLGIPIDFPALGKEGFVIRSIGDSLVIAGGQLRGNLYGVYGFLEDHLGCRWFAPGVSRIPKFARLVIGPINDRQVPVLEYRDLFLHECLDADWCARNRLIFTDAPLAEKHGGKMTYGKGFFCHTFQSLVPSAKYFKEHPEYFALFKGDRQEGALCCTNPDVMRICTEAVRAAMRAQPQATIFSVSQNDCAAYCECPACQALATQEGSQVAPALQLVNHVAAAVEKEFPNKIVDTIAYTWSQHPPRTMRPRPNVVIRLCSGACCFSHPMATCDSPDSQLFRADLNGWAKVAARIWIWDYSAAFSHTLLPFPNQRVRGPNVRFYVANNVKGILDLDIWNSPNSELCELGGYSRAKFLWNPNYDANRAMSEFLDGYYGKAAGAVRAYIDLLHDHAERKNIHVTPMVQCDSPHLTDELLIKANEWWQQAEALVAAEPEVLRRVKLSRMSVDYAILERARLQAQNKLPANAGSRSLAAARFKPFLTILDGNIFRLKETENLNIEAYRRDLARDLQINL